MSGENNIIIQKKPEITALHIIGTLMILACHFLQEVKIYSLSEIFIAGVPLFFIVSGYLAGIKKEIPINWIFKRAKRILVPYYLWILIIMLIYVLVNSGTVSVNQFMFLVTNMQGLNYIYWKSELYEAVAGLGHLWFVTVIMVCVVLTPVVNQLYNKIFPKKRSVIIMMIILILIVQPVCVIYGLQLSYIITYFFGYFIAKYPMQLTKLKYIIITLFLSVVTFSRIIFRMLIDGSDLYDRYIALVSAAMLSLWIFYTIFMMREIFPKTFEKVIKFKMLQFFSRISYEVYLTHYLFLRGLCSVGKCIANPILSNTLVFIITIFCATLLSISTSKVSQILKL